MELLPAGAGLARIRDQYGKPLVLLLGVVGAGLAAGVFITLWSRPLAASLVQDLKLSEGPLLLGGGAIVAVALLASHVPARRAARVDPMVALRHE